MKKTFLALLCVVHLSSFADVRIHNSSGVDVGYLIEAVSASLQIDDVDIFVLPTYNKTVKGQSRIYIASCSRLGEKVFRINLNFSDQLARKDRAEIDEAIIHEMIHVWQMYQGKLEVLTSNKILFNGRIYWLDRTPYNRRPWESEAERLVEHIWRHLRITKA